MRSTGTLLSLQHHMGNQAVQRMLVGRQDVSSVHQHMTQAVVQRDEDEGAANDGTITIQPVEPDDYEVSGSTLAEVHGQLDPTEWGHCRYHYDYGYETTNGVTTKIDITLSLTIRLPRWTGEGWDNASEAVKAEWNRMMGALEAHEQRHAEIAREWAPTVKSELLNQPEGDLETTFETVRGQVQDAQDLFDDESDHGQNDGVSLDLSIE